MMRRTMAWLLTAALLLACFPATAEQLTLPEEFRFTDTRFRGIYTTENLDAILEAYDLKDGWYWVTKDGVVQDYHGHENKKGWTQSSKMQAEAAGEEYFYNRGWFGCRWECNTVNFGMPNAFGWGECFGFCQFLGYLLSGEVNPHGKWQYFNSVWEAGGLQVGDIVRVEYSDDKGFHQHSAMVYSVKEDRVLFIQASGVSHNRMFIGWGFHGAGLGNTTSMREISHFPGLRIHRAYNRGDEWDYDSNPDTSNIDTYVPNLMDLDTGMVVFLDPNDLRAWDVYSNWSQWSKRATEVILPEEGAEEEESPMGGETTVYDPDAQPVAPDETDAEATSPPEFALPEPTTTPEPDAPQGPGVIRITI